MNKKEIKKYIDNNITAIKEQQLSNPHLLETLKSYWRGQWDALYNLASEIGVKVERRS